MDLTQINYLAVLVAALSAFIIGGLWYSPLLFANVWMREARISEETIKQANMVKIFGLSFILSLIISFNLAAFLGPDSDLIWGITAGALAGVGWVATSLGIIYLFERKSLKLFLINAGYLAISFIISGAIIGAWH
jgi:uncharacterized protein YneF (UPF0154 family)